jgi:hypothetical protein
LFFVSKPSGVVVLENKNANQRSSTLDTGWKPMLLCFSERLAR